jgi:hypothetical protein
MKLEVGQVWYRVWSDSDNDIDTATILELNKYMVKFKVEYFNNETPCKIREWSHSTFMSEFNIPDSALIRELL